MDAAAKLVKHLAERRKLQRRLEVLKKQIDEDLALLDGKEVVVEADPAKWYSTHSNHPKPVLKVRTGRFRLAVGRFLELSGPDGAWFIGTNDIGNIRLVKKE